MNKWCIWRRFLRLLLGPKFNLGTESQSQISALLPEISLYSRGPWLGVWYLKATQSDSAPHKPEVFRWTERSRLAVLWAPGRKWNSSAARGNPTWKRGESGKSEWREVLLCKRSRGTLSSEHTGRGIRVIAWSRSWTDVSCDSVSKIVPS